MSEIDKKANTQKQMLAEAWRVLERQLERMLQARWDEVHWVGEAPHDPAPMTGSLKQRIGNERIRWTYWETEAERAIACWLHEGNARVGIQLTLTADGFTLHVTAQATKYNGLTQKLKAILQQGERDHVINVFARCVYAITKAFIQRGVAEAAEQTATKQAMQEILQKQRN